MTGFDVSLLYPITPRNNRQNGLVLADRLALNYITRHRMAQAYAERIRPVPRQVSLCWPEVYVIIQRRCHWAVSFSGGLSALSDV
jgi:hypothetical protein